MTNLTMDIFRSKLLQNLTTRLAKDHQRNFGTIWNNL